MSDSREKHSIDWGGVEVAYRANIMSLKTIGAEFGVSDAGIIKRAKRDNWTRDLGAKIRQKAAAKVSASAVSVEVSARTKVTENLVVEANAELQSRIILSHRVDIQRTRRLAMTLLEELEIATANNDLLRELAELMFSPDKNGIDRLNELYNKVIAMPSRVDTMKKLSDALKTLISLEREAFAIDPKQNNGNGGIESVIKRVLAKQDSA